MGQVIRFGAIPRAEHVAATALNEAERLLLGAMRQWVAAFRRAERALPRLCLDMALAGVHDAAFSVDALMGILVRTARRTVEIHCPGCASLSDDERCLLDAAALAQAGERVRAEEALCGALLTAPGAAFALGPIVGLGELFAIGGLFFPRRVRPRGTRATPPRPLH